jgi:hypothetical protein
METASAPASASTGESSSSSQAAGADAREVRTTGRAFRGLMSGAGMVSRQPRTAPAHNISHGSRIMAHGDVSHPPLAHGGFFNAFPDDFNMNDVD